MGAGEGNRKIGSYLHLQQDVYAVLFCGLIKSEYKEAIENRGDLYNGTSTENADKTQDVQPVVNRDPYRGAKIGSSAKPS